MLKDPQSHVMNNEKVNSSKESKNRSIREKYADK
jgi:hypothetical protein